MNSLGETIVDPFFIGAAPWLMQIWNVFVVAKFPDQVTLGVVAVIGWLAKFCFGATVFAGGGGESSGLASLVARGLVSVGGDGVSYSEALRNAFEATAAYKINLNVIDDQGTPIDQFFLGEGDAVSHLQPEAASLTVQRLDPAELVGTVAGRLEAVIGASKETAAPDPENFAAVSQALDMDGLQVRGWGGLAVMKPQAGALDEEPELALVLVIGCSPGFVWQDAERGVVAFVDTTEELATLVADLLAE